jgi:ABC-type transporter Mla MlaB component
VGFFSFLKKKDEAPDAGPAPSAFADPGGGHGPATRMALETEAERERQREIARATAAKIDAIELAMSSDIFADEGWGSERRAPAAALPAAAAPAPAADSDLDFGKDDMPEAAVAPSSTPAVEEAAIMYANDQLDVAALVLLASLQEAGGAERLPWWMLFDLYQVMGLEHEFESIAIDYASHFETSPPAYKAATAAPQAPGGSVPAEQFSGTVPTLGLSGRLDESIAARLARVLAPSSSPLVRLEFQAVSGASPQGCALLLHALQSLRKGGRELVLAGAAELVAVLRPMLVIGDRGASPAPWLLLLELLLLTGREKDFEETAMDYCVTFEVSPPSFEAPAHAAVSVRATPTAGGDRFLLPALIRGDIAPLQHAIAMHAARHPALVLDCSRLARIDYAGANALAVQLRTLAQDGREVALRDLNHLAAALLRLLGIGTQVRLHTHKY